MFALNLPTAQLLLLGFIMSFLISFVLTPVVIRFARRYQFVDQPSRNHPAVLHQTIIPRAGGVAISVAFIVVTWLLAEHNMLLVGLLLGGLVNVIIGTLDDRFNLSPQLRLAVQFLTGLIIVLAGVSFYVTNPIGEGILYFDQWSFSLPIFNLHRFIFPGDLILIFWVVGMMNTINWSKGVSQLPGVAVIAFLTIAGVALKYQAGNPHQIQTALLAVIAAGSTLAFLPFNFPPEKMFPGFGASTFIGFNLAVLSILSGGKVAAVLIVLALPIIDAILVALKRIFTGHNPLVHDREHLYHFLLDSGMSKIQIIFLYWGTSLVFAITAVTFDRPGKIVMIIGSTILISTFFLWLYFRKRSLSRFDKHPSNS